MRVCVRVVGAGQNMQSQSAAHADDVLLSYVSPAACQNQSSIHTGKTHVHTHTHTRTLGLLAGQQSPWPGSLAGRGRAPSRFPGAAYPAVTVDLTSPCCEDMGDMGDPPKSKTRAGHQSPLRHQLSVCAALESFRFSEMLNSEN